MQSLLILISQIIQLYIWVIIASAVLSWLVAFNIVNMRNRFVYMVGDALNRLTEPILSADSLLFAGYGGLDLSPIILILGLIFLRNFLFEVFGALQSGGAY